MKLPIMDAAPPSISDLAKAYCEWQDSNGNKFTAHNYGEDNRCVKCKKPITNLGKPNQ